MAPSNRWRKQDMRKAAILVAEILVTGVAFGQLMAASPDPAVVQKVVDARVAHYKEIAKANKAIHDELGQAQPNLADVRAKARVIEALANQIPSWFPHGSGQQAGVKTEALPAIWEQVPVFKQRAAGLASAAHQLDGAAGSGSVAAANAAAHDVSLACKACHDTFRQKS
jgi:cytochrome c556